MTPKWKKKEIKDASVFEGKVTPGSGHQWYKKGDVRTKNFLIDSKTTDKKSFSITQKMWNKISYEALLSQRLPMLSIKFNKTNTEII